MQAIRRFESVLLAGRELLIGDRLAVLDFGRKIAEDVPTEVQRNEAVIAAYLGGHGTAPAIAREAS